MQVIGNDSDGHPIPGVPEPGDKIRVLWAAYEDMAQNHADAYLVRMDSAGLWWVPTEDEFGALWSPWSRIVEIEGPLT